MLNEQGLIDLLSTKDSGTTIQYTLKEVMSDEVLRAFKKRLQDALGMRVTIGTTDGKKLDVTIEHWAQIKYV